MLYLEDLKYMKLYKKKFFLPIVKSDKRHGSAILLLTPDYQGSVDLMNNEFGINRNRSFEAYYVEKDIMYTVQHESRLLQHDYESDVLHEQAVFTETTDVSFWDSINLDEGEITDYYCRLGDKLIFFNEMYDDEVYNEATNYNTKYKRLLYNDRMRNNKQVFLIYDRVKEDNPWIKKTFVRYLIENEWADPNEFSEMLHGIDVYMDAYDECENDSDNEGMEEYREYILADVEEIHDLYRAYLAECDNCEDLRKALTGVCEYTIKQNRILGEEWKLYSFNEDYWSRFCGYIKEL